MRTAVGAREIPVNRQYGHRLSATTLTIVIFTTLSLQSNKAVVMPPNTLMATYTAPTSTQVFSSSLPALPADPKDQNVNDKTAFLSALRTGVTDMQGEVNASLTQKMEEEKTAEKGKADGKHTSQEDKEEDMYGEENPEDSG